MIQRRLFVALGALALCSCAASVHEPALAAGAPARPVERADTAQIIPNGWRETVISVRDEEAMAEFYTSVLGWERRAAGAVDQTQLAAWGLPESASARYILVANPGSDRGFVRIVSFRNVAQRRIREHDNFWDTGGIFNMNLRAADMASLAPKFTDGGWQAVSEPVQLTFGPFVVNEWIPRHSDGVRIALIERIAPKLEGWPNLVTTSRSFNSTQIVADLDRALAFYQGVLGFETFIETRGPSSAPAESVIGLSREAMVSITRDVKIVNPAGSDNDGSIELLEFEGYSGRDFSAYSRPPNLGNLALRFPVPDMDALIAHLAKHNVALEYAPVEASLAPYGRVKITAIRAPDGAWLEFFETLN